MPPLQVGYALWPGFFPIVIAHEKGFFDQQRVKVELVYLESYLQSVSDFSAGKYDGIGLALGSLMSIIRDNPDAQIVMLTDESAGGDALVVQNHIQSLADLKGKRIGVKLGDVGELFVNKILEKKHLTTNDVTLVNIEGEAVPARLIKGDIQAGHTWHPHILPTVKAGGRVLFTSKETPGLIPSAILFRSSAIATRPKQIQAFIRAWFQAQDYWKANPEESKVLIAKKLNLKPELVSAEGIQLYNLQENLKGFTPGSTTESLYYTTKLYADFAIRTGTLSTAPDIQKLINPSFVQQLRSGSSS